MHARAVLPAVLDVLGSGFDPSLVTVTVASFDDAIDALAAPLGKTVLTRV